MSSDELTPEQRREKGDELADTLNSSDLAKPQIGDAKCLIDEERVKAQIEAKRKDEIRTALIKDPALHWTETSPGLEAEVDIIYKQVMEQREVRANEDKLWALRRRLGVIVQKALERRGVDPLNEEIVSEFVDKAMALESTVTPKDQRPEERRVRLPDSRPSITQKGVHNQMEFYVTVGFYDPEDNDHRADPGEVFVKVAKQGSDTSIFIDAWAVMVSLALQSGVPWSKIKEKFSKYPYPNLVEAIVSCIDTAILVRRQQIGLDE